MDKIVAVSEFGRVIGEDHPGAKLTDFEVELIRTLHERDRLSLRVLAAKFEVSKSSVAMICRYSRRAITPDRYKRVHVTDE